MIVSEAQFCVFHQGYMQTHSLVKGLVMLFYSCVATHPNPIENIMTSSRDATRANYCELLVSPKVATPKFLTWLFLVLLPETKNYNKNNNNKKNNLWKAVGLQLLQRHIQCNLSKCLKKLIYLSHLSITMSNI